MDKDKSEPKQEINSSFTGKAKLVILLLFALVVLAISFKILQPFLPVIAWALALTTATYFLHQKIQRVIGNENLAAGLSVFLLAVVIIVPAIFVLGELLRTSSENIDTLSSVAQRGKWRDAIESMPRAAKAMHWLDSTFGLQKSVQDSLNFVKGWAPTVLASSVATVVNLFLVLFTSFFFYRDSNAVLRTLKEFIPLSVSETEEILERATVTIYATIYGTLLVAFIQGMLGGLMFWILGVPAPLLWGVIMALLALIPYFGAFIIWVPAAVIFAIQGSWTEAIVLTIWGGVVIALIDNILYPLLVGKQLRLHTLPVFFFILGGVMFFGASGLILGPVSLAVGNGVFEICRRHLRSPAVR